MNRETKFVIGYFKQEKEFLENIRKLTFGDAVSYMKSDLDLEVDIELTQIQYNLFYAAMDNINWNEVIIELEI